MFVYQLDNLSERLHQEAENRSRAELTNKQQQQGNLKSNIIQEIDEGTSGSTFLYLSSYSAF